MGKDKLKRFRENLEFTSLFQPEFEELFRKDYHMKGRWNELYFKNDNPIVLELGCGRGEYTVNLSKKYPHQNFIGIDIKGARLWRGTKTVHTQNIPNALFIRARIEFIEWLFAPQEVSEIWITFPDPQIRRDNKRLTAPIFLERYQKFLIDNGTIHLKTDSPYLHFYTRELLNANNIEIGELVSDVHSLEGHELLSIKTHYEEQYINQGHPITYLSFRLPVNKKIVAPIWDHNLYER